MCFPKVLSDDMKKLKARMVMSSLAELEDDFKEGYLETVAAYYEEQHPELTPLLEKERDGLRCRGNRSPVPDVEDPATEEPGESFCDKSYGAPRGDKEELTPQKCSEPQSSK
ncbi:interleukin-32 isoform G [Homo sapiens]|uniref:Interleukin-32 eta n=1 Tax=Homo sapiens TaxID=9606 RepID=G3LU47_HUMAN|nr:interleukin-32 isoform G [Homo sapiens]AEN74995.1 interleukin-32 eta [Homo sapiens]